MKIKNSCIFLSVLFISTSVFAMESSIKDQANDIVQKMLECTRPIYEAKVEQVLNQGIFPEHSIFDYKRDSKLSDVAYKRFGMLADLCDSRHLPLLEMLLQSKKASTNTSLILATGTRITLFTETLDRSVKDNSEFDRFSALELLLKYGADPNQESMSLANRRFCEEHNYKEELFIDTPLFLAISSFKEDLVKLLLSYNALPNKYSQKFSPLMVITYQYSCCNSDYRFKDKMRAYKILQALLDKKADVLQPSSIPCENKIATPMQFAKDKKLPEIVALFEQHQRGKK